MNVQASTIARVSAELPVRIAARAVDVGVLALIDVGLGRLMGFGFDWLAVGRRSCWSTSSAST